MARGDHIYVQRLGGLYTHHGIDCGDDVIHLTAAGPGPPSVRRIARAEFAEGGEILVRDYTRFFAAQTEAERALRAASLAVGRALDAARGIAQPLDAADVSPDAVVARAESRLGEVGFDVWLNNCEHFATWCRTGISNSAQIDQFWKLSLGPAGYFWHKTAEWMTRTLD